MNFNDLTPYELKYSDIKGHWAVNFIEEVSRHNIIKVMKTELSDQMKR